MDGSRTQLVGWILATASTPRLAPRPWRLEEALAQGSGSDSWAAGEIRSWLRPGATGPSAAGLAPILAALQRAGALVFSPEWRSFVVDPWWREELRADLPALVDHASQDTLACVAAALDQLEGHVALAS